MGKPHLFPAAWIGSIGAALLAPACGAFLLLAAPATAAEEVAAFNVAVERFAVHHRVALGYLRTGNNDLAMIEIERMQDAWRGVAARGGKPPPALAGQQIWITTLTDISMRIVAAHMMLGSGRPELARANLAEMRASLAKLRQAGGIAVLADAVLEANAAMDALFAYDRAPPDFSQAEARDALAAKAQAYRQALARCEALADAGIRGDPEFRRLIDGARASADLIGKAIETQDGDLLHRLLIELRAYDNLLAFRYG